MDGGHGRHRATQGKIDVEPVDEIARTERPKALEGTASAAGDRARPGDHFRWKLVGGIGLDGRNELGCAHTGEGSEELSDVGLNPAAAGTEGQGVEGDTRPMDSRTPRIIQK